MVRPQRSSMAVSWSVECVGDDDSDVRDDDALARISISSWTDLYGRVMRSLFLDVGFVSVRLRICAHFS